MSKDNDFVSSLGYLSLAVRLKRISDHMMHSARQVYKLRGLDIEPNWYLVFKLLQEKKCLSITQIGVELNFSHPSVVNIVKKMNANGYLTCVIDSKDSRRQLVKLSAHALEQLPEMERFWEAGERSIAALFDTEDDFLEKLDRLDSLYRERDFMTRALDELKQ